MPPPPIVGAAQERSACPFPGLLATGVPGVPGNAGVPDALTMTPTAVEFEPPGKGELADSAELGLYAVESANVGFRIVKLSDRPTIGVPLNPDVSGPTLAFLPDPNPQYAYALVAVEPDVSVGQVSAAAGGGSIIIEPEATSAQVVEDPAVLVSMSASISVYTDVGGVL